MGAYELPVVNEERLVNEIVAQHAIPEAVDRISVEFGTDHDGDAAFTLIFSLRPNVEKTSATFDTIYSFWDRIRLQLWAIGIARIPYMRLKRESSDNSGFHPN